MRVIYPSQKVFILKVLTHKEYDQEKWKEECGCFAPPAAAYEDDHYSLSPASDADMLRHLMEAKGVSQIELHRSTKIPKSTISEILNGKKSFSRQNIVTLADYFGVAKSILTHNL